MWIGQQRIQQMQLYLMHTLGGGAEASFRLIIWCAAKWRIEEEMGAHSETFEESVIGCVGDADKLWALQEQEAEKADNCGTLSQEKKGFSEQLQHLIS